MFKPSLDAGAAVGATGWALDAGACVSAAAGGADVAVGCAAPAHAEKTIPIAIAAASANVNSPPRANPRKSFVLLMVAFIPLSSLLSESDLAVLLTQVFLH